MNDDTSQRSSATMGSHQFCLKWRRHPSDEAAALKLAPYGEEPGDVTLVCEGFFLNANKTVLSTFSPFFREQFVTYPSKETTVIPNGIRCSDLEALVEFMYHGEVVVEKGQLTSLLKAAETLKVKGRLVFTRGERPEKDRRRLAKRCAADGETLCERRGDSPPSKRICLGLERHATSQTNLNNPAHQCTPSTSRILDSQRPMVPRTVTFPSDHFSTIMSLAASASTTCTAVSSAASQPSCNSADYVKSAAKVSFASPRAAGSMTSDISARQNADRAVASTITRDVDHRESSLLQNVGNMPQRMFSAVQLTLPQPSSSSDNPNSDLEQFKPFPGISMTRDALPKSSPVGTGASWKDSTSGASMTDDNLWETISHRRHYREDKRETISSHLPVLSEQSVLITDDYNPSERKECSLPSSTTTATTQPHRPQDSTAVLSTEKLISHCGEEFALPSTSKAPKRRRAVKEETVEAADHRPVTRSMTGRQQKPS